MVKTHHNGGGADGGASGANAIVDTNEPTDRPTNQPTLSARQEAFHRTESDLRCLRLAVFVAAPRRSDSRRAVLFSWQRLSLPRRGGSSSNEHHNTHGRTSRRQRGLPLTQQIRQLPSSACRSGTGDLSGVLHAMSRDRIPLVNLDRVPAFSWIRRAYSCVKVCNQRTLKARPNIAIECMPTLRVLPKSVIDFKRSRQILVREAIIRRTEYGR